ncbi:MAG: hypothetical protein V3T24_02960, partial [Longimicrobiales bacterium]
MTIVTMSEGGPARSIAGAATLVVAVGLAASALSAQQRGLRPDDYYDLVTVGDVAVSPLGDLVAFTVTRIVEAENKRHREVWMQALENGRPDGPPYRFTDPTEDSHSPSWALDGSMLAFTSRRGADANSSWFVRVRGPGGEASHIDGVRGSPVWSADGRWIAYTFPPGDDDEEDDVDREGWIAPDAVSRTLDGTRFDGRVVTSTRYKRDGVLTLRPHFSVAEKSQLYVVSARGGQPRQLTNLDFDVEDVRWSPDGRLLFFTGDEREDDEQDRARRSDMWVARLTDGSVTKVTETAAAETSPALSPDGGR